MMAGVDSSLETGYTGNKVENSYASISSKYSRLKPRHAEFPRAFLFILYEKKENSDGLWFDRKT